MYLKRRQLCSALGLGLLLSKTAFAQRDYPEKPIKFIVPTSPGSGPDVLARGMAQLMSASLGQAFVVDNRVGAAANIGFNAVAKAPADGYTIGIVPNQFSINPSLYKLPFDTMKDFEPICLVAQGAMVLVTKPSLDVTDLASFIAMAKKKPTSISYGSAGSGSPQHMAGALLESMADVKLLHVPYSGVAGAVVATLAGEVDAMFMAAQTAAVHVKSGKLRAIAVTTKRPSAVLPNVPTADAAGLPGFDVGLWFGLVMPAGVPASIASRIGAEAAKALKDPHFVSTLTAQGLEPAYLPRQEFVALIKADMERWSSVVKRLNIKVE
ncbi:MAG: transporter [Herminiimonas sp.]|jgi:tripartite-type tricarboxylate transporter receptor subunit TctC|nr:transporter [Herminiimonas sp.]